MTEGSKQALTRCLALWRDLLFMLCSPGVPQPHAVIYEVDFISFVYFNVSLCFDCPGQHTMWEGGPGGRGVQAITLGNLE